MQTVQALDELCWLYCWQFYYATIFTPTRAYFQPLYDTKKNKLTPKTGYLLTCTVIIQELGGALQNCFTHRALPWCRGSHFEKSTVKAGKRCRGDLGWVGVHKINGTVIFRSFRLEREKRNTSEDFHLFWKLSGGISCTNRISNRNFRFLLTNGKRP